MNDVAHYRVLILVDGKLELTLYLSKGGGFTRREIDAAVRKAKSQGDQAMAQLQDNLQQVRIRGAAA